VDERTMILICLYGCTGLVPASRRIHAMVAHSKVACAKGHLRFFFPKSAEAIVDLRASLHVVSSRDCGLYVQG
jgi:hypothetical protein